MEGIGSSRDGRAERIGIGTEEVTHINEPAVVFVIYRADERFDAFGSLENVAVIFGAGAYTLCSGIFRNAADMGNHDLDGVLPGEATVGRERVADIVTKYLRTEGFGDINATAKTLDLRIDILLHEVSTYGVSDDFKTDFFAMLAYLLGACHGICRDAESAIVKVDKLYAIKAEFLRQIADVNIVALCVLDVFSEAITGNTNFHKTPQR